MTPCFRQTHRQVRRFRKGVLAEGLLWVTRKRHFLNSERGIECTSEGVPPKHPLERSESCYHELEFACGIDETIRDQGGLSDRRGEK